MDFLEKARMRMEHWIAHNQEHQNAYQEFADQLEAAGKTESADSIREMSNLVSKSNQYLKKALQGLE